MPACPLCAGVPEAYAISCKHTVLAVLSNGNFRITSVLKPWTLTSGYVAQLGSRLRFQWDEVLSEMHFLQKSGQLLQLQPAPLRSRPSGRPKGTTDVARLKSARDGFTVSAALALKTATELATSRGTGSGLGGKGGVKTCSSCHQPGHRINRCPLAKETDLLLGIATGSEAHIAHPAPGFEPPPLTAPAPVLLAAAAEAFLGVCGTQEEANASSAQSPCTSSALLGPVKAAKGSKRQASVTAAPGKAKVAKQPTPSSAAASRPRRGQAAPTPNKEVPLSEQYADVDEELRRLRQKRKLDAVLEVEGGEGSPAKRTPSPEIEMTEVDGCVFRAQRRDPTPQLHLSRRSSSRVRKLRRLSKCSACICAGTTKVPCTLLPVRPADPCLQLYFSLPAACCTQ